MGERADAVRPERRMMLALGGHEFSRKLGNEAIVEYLLALADSRRPRICLLPTASGDPAEQIAAFRSIVGGRECEPSHLSLFRLESEPRGDIRRHLLSQDVIYAGGGSLINLIAIWRAHGVDAILRECWGRGVLLIGQSAGAMCWFERGVTLSAGSVRVAPGLGLLPGITSVRYHRDPDRRMALHHAVEESGGPGYGIDDAAGLLFRGGSAVLAVSRHGRAGVWRG